MLLINDKKPLNNDKTKNPLHKEEDLYFQNNIYYLILPTLIRYSAICTALRAAPLRI